jgi:putative pyruvate formate lyase activating enzyme
MDRLPSYIELYQKGELARRVEQARQRLVSCDLCGRACRINRLEGETGTCRSGMMARVASFGPHHGEEAPISGQRGSGTVFFSGCNLRCIFCQNHEISQGGGGHACSAGELAGIMLELQHMGCHNINLVSPTHVLAAILEALPLAVESGLKIPLVYNTGGYDSLEALRLLDGIIDIYMPDLKYGNAETALKYSGIKDYPGISQSAILEMHRQVGDLQLDGFGVARRGVLVRHLVLPGGLGGTAEVVRFLAEKVSRNTFVNLMDQYRPEWMAVEFPAINRRITREEFDQALELAREAGLALMEV